MHRIATSDYVLALKGNQGTLCEDVEGFVAEQKANNFKNTKVSRHETLDNVNREEPDGSAEGAAFVRWHEPDDARECQADIDRFAPAAQHAQV
jgi:hypothetical protein